MKQTSTQTKENKMYMPLPKYIRLKNDHWMSKNKKHYVYKSRFEKGFYWEYNGDTKGLFNDLTTIENYINQIESK